MRLVAAEEVGEEVEGVTAVLSGGPEDGHEDGLSVGAGFGAVAAPDFAVGGEGSHGLFGAVVGGIQAGDVEEGEEVVAMGVEVFGQSFVAGMDLGPGQYPVEAGLPEADGDSQAVGRNRSGVAAVAQRQGVPEETLHLAWKVDGPADGHAQEFAAAVEEVSETLLMQGEAEPVIRRPAVVDQVAGVIGTDDRFGGFKASPPVDVIAVSYTHLTLPTNREV